MKYRIHKIEWVLWRADAGLGYTGPGTVDLVGSDARQALPRLLALDHRAHAMIGKNLEQQAMLHPAVDHVHRLDPAARCVEG